MSWRPLPKTLKELRIHLCQTSAGSAGTREFILKNYPPLKTSNPTLPILIRESRGVEARVFGRFEFGQEKKVELEGLGAEEVERAVRGLVGEGGK